MAKARAGERPNDKRTKAKPSPRRSSSVDPTFIQRQLELDIARSICVDTTVDVRTEDASRHNGTAATGGYRSKNNNVSYSQGSNNATSTGAGQPQRVNSSNGDNVLPCGILTGRNDPRHQARNFSRGNSNVSGNGITTYGHSDVSTPAIHLTGADGPLKMHTHAASQNHINKKHTKAPSPSLSPSARKSDSRVAKPKRGSPATEQQRKSKFIEEMMRDKVSRVPPPQFLGDEPTFNGKGRGTKDGSEDRKEAFEAKKHGPLRKIFSSFFPRNSFSDESKSAKQGLKTRSPVKEGVSVDDWKAMADKEYEKLKAQRFQGTAKSGQSGIPDAVPATPATIDHSTATFTSAAPSKTLTPSKSLFDLSSTKRRSSAVYQKLVKKRSNLAEKIAKVDKKLARLAGEEAQNEQPAGYAQDSDAEMPVVAPGPSRVQNASQGRHHRHAFAPRPLPSIPSERLINEMAEDDETNEQPAATANTRCDFSDKELPPPPCSALKASLRGEKRPKPAIKDTNDTEKPETRKRKGAMVVEEPEFNEDEYLRAFCSYDNEKDSDYSLDDGPATSDTNTDFDYTSERRYLPSRRAKQAKTTAENSTLPQETPIPPRRSSRSLRNRHSADYPVSVTPGEKGHEDVPPVPPVPTKLPKRSGKKKKNREENKENHPIEETEEYQWPSDIF